MIISKSLNISESIWADQRTQFEERTGRPWPAQHRQGTSTGSASAQILEFCNCAICATEWSRNGCRTNFFIQGGIDAPQPWMLRNSPALHGRFRNSEGMFVLCLSLSTVRFLTKKNVECTTQCSGWGSVFTIAGKTSGRGQVTQQFIASTGHRGLPPCYGWSAASPFNDGSLHLAYVCICMYTYVDNVFMHMFIWSYNMNHICSILMFMQLYLT